MGQYQVTRNLEASIIQQLQEYFDADWTGVNVEKTFARIYDIDLPSIYVRSGATTHDRAEIGSTDTVREALILIDVFATSDGQKLDLKDYIIRKVKKGFTYYKYTIVDGQIQSKIEDGRIHVITIDENPVNFDDSKDNLDIHDRYRWNIALTVRTGKVED